MTIHHRNALSRLAFTSTTKSNIRAGNASSTLLFVQVAECVTVPINVIATSLLTFSQSALPGNVPNYAAYSELLFTQSAVGVRVVPGEADASNTLTFRQTLSYKKIKAVQASNTLILRSNVNHYFESIYISNIDLPVPFN